jgi:hypothetical protein
VCPDIPVFEVSAKTGIGMEDWLDFVVQCYKKFTASIEATSRESLRLF